MRLRRPVAALVSILVVLAAGCGGDAEEKNAYVDDVQVAQRAFVVRFEQVRKRLTPTSTIAQDRTSLGDFATATATFVAALGKIEPPVEVRDEHRGLVRAVADYQEQVERARAKLRDGSAPARARVRTDLSSSVEGTQAKITEAIGRINAGLRD